MEITWKGHSCFVVEEDGYRIVLDPYREVRGYPKLSVEGHEVLCSHGHDDHGYRDAVTLLPKRESPFSVHTVATFHDKAEGAARGNNLVHVIEADGIRIAHLGDLGHLLSPEQVAQIGRCDVVLLPVGGYYTITGDEAAELSEMLDGGILVPMHYRFGKYGYQEIDVIDTFLGHFAPSQIRRVPGNSFTVGRDPEFRVVVLTFQE